MWETQQNFVLMLAGWTGRSTVFVFSLGCWQSKVSTLVFSIVMAGE